MPGMFSVPATPESERNTGPSTTPSAPPPTTLTSQSFTPTGLPKASQATKSSQVQSVLFSKQSLSNDFENIAPTNNHAHGAFSNLSEPAPALNNALIHAQLESSFDAGDSLMLTPRGSKRLRNGNVMKRSTLNGRNAEPIKDRKSTMPAIARSVVAQAPQQSTLCETDDLLLTAEHLLDSLDRAVTNAHESNIDQESSLTAKRFMSIWQDTYGTQSVSAAIGPSQNSNEARAAYIAALLLQIHHSCPLQDADGPLLTTQRHALRRVQDDHVSIPKALLDWLNVFHNPFPEDLSDVMHTRPSSTANERFWDTVFSTMLRGQFAITIELLENADFADAETAQEDGYEQPGYKGRQLVSIRHVVSRCVELLRLCPTLQDDDWNIVGSGWTLFRSRVRRTLEDLEAYAEDDSADRDDIDNVFERSRLGGSISAASRRAESKVPWTIYQQLKILYGQLLGSRDEIVDSAQDWLEAVMYTTVWWDGESAADFRRSTTQSKRAFSAGRQTREVDSSPQSAYKRRLLESFAGVTDDPQDVELGVNTLDVVQVALACVFEDEFDSVLAMLRSWSLPTAVVVVEIASAAGWLPATHQGADTIMNGFDEDDLMVLNHARATTKDAPRRDSVLAEYAHALALREHLQSSDGSVYRQGWEMAVRVLSRLDNAETAERKITEVFTQMQFETSDQVDLALSACADLGLTSQASTIAQRYADHIAKSTHAYGEAILYYARGRCGRHLQETLDLLISTSLVQSAAYPPQDALDPQLASLVSDQRNALSSLARVDIEAAKLLTTHLSGYATVRRFYELRDNMSEKSRNKGQALGPRGRRNEAAKALIALIESASDSIRGGLFDSDANTIVQVDTLLLLLGEALPLMSQKHIVLKRPHLMTLLRALEDLHMVVPRVYEQAEAMFKAGMSDYHKSRGESNEPQDDMIAPGGQKINKSLLHASSYAMVNSRGSVDSDGRSAAGADGVQRGWDWRKGMALAGGKNCTGADVLRILRVQIAKELARVWTEPRTQT